MPKKTAAAGASRVPRTGFGGWERHPLQGNRTRRAEGLKTSCQACYVRGSLTYRATYLVQEPKSIRGGAAAYRATGVQARGRKGCANLPGNRAEASPRCSRALLPTGQQGPEARGLPTGQQKSRPESSSSRYLQGNKVESCTYDQTSTDLPTGQPNPSSESPLLSTVHSGCLIR